MRKATLIIEIGKAHRIMIDNFGTTNLISFADILFHAGRIDLKLRNKCNKTALTDRFATELLNNNIDLFPIQF